VLVSSVAFVVVVVVVAVVVVVVVVVGFAVVVVGACETSADKILVSFLEIFNLISNTNPDGAETDCVEVMDFFRFLNWQVTLDLDKSTAVVE